MAYYGRSWLTPCDDPTLSSHLGSVHYAALNDERLIALSSKDSRYSSYSTSFSFAIRLP